MSSSCADIANCTFYYSQASTPGITGIAPATGTKGTRVAITGRNLRLPPSGFGSSPAGSVVVMIGNAPCSVDPSTWTSTLVECEVGFALAGSHPVVLTVPNAGDAIVDEGVAFTATVAVDSVLPARGSHGGGDRVTITGGGFGQDTAAVKVDFCGAACSVESVSPSAITCTTSPLDTAQSFLAFDNIEPTVIKPTTRRTILAPDPIETIDAKYATGAGKKCSQYSNWRYGCGEHATIDDIQRACDADAQCAAFSMRDGAPDCLTRAYNGELKYTRDAAGYTCYAKHATAPSSFPQTGGWSAGDACAAVPLESRGQCETCFLDDHCQGGLTCSPYMRKCVRRGAEQCPGPTARCPACADCTATGCDDCTGCLSVGPGKRYSWLEYANLDHTEGGPGHYSRTCTDGGHDSGDGTAAANKPTVVPFADSGALASAYNAFDRSFFSDYKSSSKGACFVGLDMGAGRSAVVTRIRFFPVNLVDVPGKVYRQPGGFAMKGGVFQVAGALAGPWTTVATITAPHQGWNVIKVAATAQAAGRYVRYHGTAGSDCILSQLEFVGVTLSSASRCHPRITTRVARPALSFKDTWPAPESVHILDNVAFDYSAAATPNITSVEPRFGSSLGGTTVTIAGRGLPATAAGVGGVVVNGAPCTLQAVSATQITCITTKRGQFEAPSVRVWHKGAPGTSTSGSGHTGSAVQRQGLRMFRFLDRWSEANTWLNDEMPGEMDSVLVPADQTLLMDMSVTPKLRTILVQGVLVFDRIDADLHAEFIIVQGGLFEIGTEDEPFEQDVTITLHGKRDGPSLPTVGNKAIAVMSSPGHGASAFGGGAWASLRDVGELDIHGRVRARTWTKVANPVAAGDLAIDVADGVDFQAGDRIVLSSPPEELEVADVVAGGKRIVLAAPAAKSHASSIRYVDGEEVDMRCEVGLLSHNIVIQGDADTDKEQAGAQIIATMGSEVRVSHTEVRRCGAAGKAQHCIHIHQLGEVADRASYVEGVSVHHGWNRGVVLAGTNSFVMQGTVGFHVEGHMFHQADFESEWNVYENNLGVYTRKTLGCGRSDCKPATFSIYNPKNYWRYNTAADSMKYAFGFSMPCGTEATRFPMKEFFKNTAHHSGTGLKTSCTYTPSTTVYIHNNTFHSNRGSGAFHKAAGNLHHVHSRFARNTRMDINWALLIPTSADRRADPQIRDSYFVGGTGAVAIEGPSSEYFLVSGATFTDYGAMPAIKGCRTCCGEKTWQGAYTYTYENLKFFNSDVRIGWNCPFKQIYFDKDGSLTGHVNGSATAYKKFNDWTDAKQGDPCAPGNATFSGGIVCDGSVRVRRLEFKVVVFVVVFDIVRVVVCVVGTMQELRSWLW